MKWVASGRRPAGGVGPPAALGGGQHALELGARVEGALGEHGAVAVERDRERAAGDVGSGPRLGSRASSNVRTTTRGCVAQGRDRGRQRAAHAAAVGSEDRQAETTAVGLELRAQRAAAPELRSLVRHLERADRVPRPGAASRARARARTTATPSATRPSSATPRPIASQPSALTASRGSSGSAANAAASSAVRATEPREMRPRPPKHAHGAPARPLISDRALGRAEDGEQHRGGVGEAVQARADADRQHQLDRHEHGEHRPRPANHAVRGQRRARARCVGELRHGGEQEDEPEDQAGDDRRHRGRR